MCSLVAPQGGTFTSNAPPYIWHKLYHMRSRVHIYKMYRRVANGKPTLYNSLHSLANTVMLLKL